jgi:hypothetical protein
MNDKQKVATAIVATALAVGGGGALAAGHGGSSASSSASSAASANDSHLGPLSAAATYLGLTTGELRTQLGAGKSLAAIATAQGKSVSGLEDALLANLKTDLDADVAAGRITSDRETQILADAKARIAAQVARAGLPAGRGDHGDRAGLEHAAAQYLGLTDAQLETQLQAGKSLAAVATAQGKTVAGLKAALVAQFSSTLDAYVNATHVGGPGFGGPGFGGDPGFRGGPGFRPGGGFHP